MILSVFERLLLLNILPKEGDLTTLKIVRTLRDNLSFSEEEHAALQFKHEGGNVMWKDEAEANKDVVIGEKAMDIIVDALKALNRAKKLTDQHVDLYEKFVKEN
jgi:hypothetical protein